MKIARIVFELDFGGVEKKTQLAVIGFQVFPGISIQTISLGRGGRVAANLIRDGYPVWVMNQKAKIPSFSLIYRLSKYFKKEGFDLVHTVGAEANFHGLLAATLAGVHFRIGEEIGIPNHHSLYRVLFNFTYKFAQRVVCVSEAVKQHLYEIGELPLSKAKVIYNPIELPELQKRQRHESDSLIFITVSRLTPIKNISSVIRSLAAIIKETAFRPKLIIVGDGEDRTALKFSVLELEVDEYITFAGYRKNVFETLCEADVFVIPSFSEGSSLALAEAMHAGLPSIVTKIGGTTEILGDSCSGVLIDPYIEDELKSAMLAFLNLTPSERVEMGKRAQQQSERFSVENYCKELLSLYSGLSIPVKKS